jgi:UDP-GlcNAc:undecaprenyl-phosphate/decaprenyl-phosphate GlcNAc-1-phosphate transferase
MLTLPRGSFDVGPYVCAFLVAFVAALLSARGVRDLAIWRGWVTSPSLSRHVHRRAVPRIGGVAIYASSCLAAAVVLLLQSAIDPGAARTSAHRLLAIFVPATLIFGLGLVDDFRDLRARTKLAVQTLAALLLYASGLGVTHLSAIFGSSPVPPFIGVPLTVVWVVAITNAFNLIDGLDGLAAGSAFFSTLIVFAVSLMNGSHLIAVVAVALAGSILGFLRYNFNPASIFLGDSGSLYIGFLLSAAALAGSQKSSTMVAVAIPVVSLGLPILDVGIAIARRFLRGRPLFEADSDHIHHKLLKRGLSHRDAVLILYGVSALFGLLSMILYPRGHLLVPVLALIGLGVFLGVQQLRYHEFTELQRVARRIVNQMRVISNNIAIRRAAEALQSCQTLGDIGAVIIGYLEPIGFDGFALEMESLDEVPEAGLLPFHRKSSDVICLGDSEADAFALRLEFCLAPSTGGRKRSFSVFRACCKDPLWFDSNVFVSSGFITALDKALLQSLQAHYAFAGAGKRGEKAAVAVASSAAD